MQTIIERLWGLLSRAISQAWQQQISEGSSLLIPEITPVAQEQFGHYQCNNALKLAKELKKNPKEVAEAIAVCLRGYQDPCLSSIDIAGPGFINLTLDPIFLAQQIHQILLDPRLGVPLRKHPQKVIVEFSSPNIAKELHVGHLRSTIIGDCLARLFEFLGHDVIRLNHVGDWGTQFGMLIAFLKEYQPKVLIGEEPTNLSELMQWYKESKKKFDEDPEFKTRSQKEVVTLQGGDPGSLKAWQMICEISRRAFHAIYSLMDVSLVERGESFYNPYLEGIVKDLEQKGLVTISGGAKCVFLEGFFTRERDPLPMIIQKSDGGYNYETTDMAALRHRVDVEKADRIIYVTDAGQALHFEQVFQAARKAQYYDPARVQIEHVTFGVVLGADGKKFKTRSGATEKLIDLLFEAVKKASEIVADRLPDMSGPEQEELSRTLGIGAVKYADLSCHRVKDYVFSYDRMLRFEGNTAAFLLYAFVRIEGIKRKGGKDISLILNSAQIQLTHPSEISLALHIRRFSEILDMMAKDLLPNRLCDYLYALAEKFNGFYRDCRVDGVPEEKSRLLLCEAVSRILAKGLNLLGLKTVSRM
ncbi:MAG: arginine--tRNA ligase [Chlamydiae bacterium]|nr:arginine--tRNA ligase [Chlamydiota bacterium]